MLIAHYTRIKIPHSHRASSHLNSAVLVGVSHILTYCNLIFLSFSLGNNNSNQYFARFSAVGTKLTQIIFNPSYKGLSIQSLNNGSLVHNTKPWSNPLSRTSIIISFKSPKS